MKDPKIEQALENISKSINDINNEMEYLINEGMYVRIDQDENKKYHIKTFQQHINYLEQGDNKL